MCEMTFSKKCVEVARTKALLYKNGWTDMQQEMGRIYEVKSKEKTAGRGADQYCNTGFDLSPIGSERSSSFKCFSALFLKSFIAYTIP
jgi:hypothetical protein